MAKNVGVKDTKTFLVAYQELFKKDVTQLDENDRQQLQDLKVNYPMVRIDIKEE